jgi:hypothetical protein
MFDKITELSIERLASNIVHYTQQKRFIVCDVGMILSDVGTYDEYHWQHKYEYNINGMPSFTQCIIGVDDKKLHLVNRNILSFRLYPSFYNEDYFGNVKLLCQNGDSCLFEVNLIDLDEKNLLIVINYLLSAINGGKYHTDEQPIFIKKQPKELRTADLKITTVSSVLNNNLK